MKYAIYPPIGIARVGNSADEFFIGAETLDTVGTEIRTDGSEQPVHAFKDALYRTKRQGARFHLFEVPDDGSAPRPASLPAGATVTWSVKLGNAKDAVKRPPAPPDRPRAIQLDPARTDRLILTEGNVSGASAPWLDLDGSYRGTTVKLGTIFTDSSQRLVVLGGHGTAASLSNPPAPIGADFYNNPDWYDDVSDGPVSARISIPGAGAVDAAPAWVCVAPPDFSPLTRGIVTLRDVILGAAYENGVLQQPEQVSFDTDIRPMIERASALQLVSSNALWHSISTDWAALADPSAANQPLRQNTAQLVRQCENVLQSFELRAWQLDALDRWADGDFTAAARPDRGLCDQLTRAALDGTVGQGFFPGIETGINVTDVNLYDLDPFEFRFGAGLAPGDLTAHMAQPWQADFLKCGSGWWPAQRPNEVPQEAGPARPWLRPTMTHARLVDDVMKLGIVSTNDTGLAVEQGRDPALGA
ncbi:LodA/GoxA family CTQ-dependent oxidase [Pseudoduganella chitinolytica]|uniref:LodA/GoxA family CTQ-dependent oxidase n=1 Tax=Pseudoduganella chitinolytica TaxID=34070 RepID=A0ABY8BG05_9BURK|nr:LodA/GoxA family CTQ-dependent oxidase [Pseudoduganella chitinolytica]WEF34233.1 LodA/GoxA family CTQ-dependent oxidase [Pseudoduganella chitinolytica]